MDTMAIDGTIPTMVNKRINKSNRRPKNHTQRSIFSHFHTKQAKKLESPELPDISFFYLLHSSNL